MHPSRHKDTHIGIHEYTLTLLPGEHNVEDGEDEHTQHEETFTESDENEAIVGFPVHELFDSQKATRHVPR